MNSRIIAVGILAAAAAGEARAQTQAGQKPRLVVLVVVDQLRGDYLDRFEGALTAGGFARLIRDGAFFINAHFSHGVTATGPGHACIVTGVNPRVHGISANEAPFGECIDDAKFPLVGGADARRTAKGASPSRMLAASLGDVFKMHSNGRAKVVSVGIKSRSVILMGGKNADDAVWFDARSGRFVSSRYYGDGLPGFADEFNRAGVVAGYFGRKWDRFLPTEAYAICGPDDEPAESDLFGLGRTFPRTVNGGLKSPGPTFYAAFQYSPFGDDVVFELAGRAIDAEKLGQRDTCDLLCMALSSYDLVGHFYGPDSHEILDATARLDTRLAAMFKALDAKVGRDRYVVVLTGDHGVAPIAARARRWRLDAGAIVESEMKDALNAKLRETLKIADARLRPVAEVELPWVHLDTGALRSASLPADTLTAAAEQELRGMPGVARVIPCAALAGPLPAGADDELRLAWQSYHPEMSGEFYVALKPYWHKNKDDQAASHSTLHDYDRHVPIVLYGPGIRAGRYASEADPINIARTLCAHLGMQPAATMAGRVLAEAVEAPSRR